jgi:hypothetical protein
MANTCAVTGNVKNLLNSNVQNCTIKASVLTPFFHGTTWISGELASTVTDSSGNFSITVIETTTVGKKISFTFEYNDGTGAIKKKNYTVVVPNTPTVTLSDLVTADASPVTANTFPASSVTVVPTGGLVADDVQDALTELQTDIDAITTLADGKIYIGNAANSFSEVTPSGDVTITNTGVTAIASGVIVNADVSSTAAIAHSKLADITAASVLMGNASNVPTATAITGDISLSNAGVTAIGSGVIVNADVNASAAIAYSKLNLSGSLVDADVNASAAIAYSKLSLGTSIVNADVAAAAAIARTKLASGTNYRVLANNSSGVMSENAALTANNVVTADANGQLTGVAPGTSGNLLTSNGTTWASTAPAASTIPTVQKFTSGSGTYTTPANVRWIRVRMVGGGGGGAGGGTGAGSAAGAGGNTTFGTTLLEANGGAAGALVNGADGGTASLGSGPVGIAADGGYGSSVVASTGTNPVGGHGGVSFFGGAGAGVGGGAGIAAKTNSGSGGGGGGASAANTYGGGGGGAGGFIDAIIASPSATYSYAVGAAGTAGGAGASGSAGAAGGAGIILVEEFY